MAKISGPLLSFSGAGSIGKTITYSRWRGIPYTRQHVIPANPNSTAQQLTRSTFALLREMFKISPTIAINPWNAFATGRPFTGFNSFIGENLRVMRGDPDMTNFIGSPGARGGVPPESVTAAPGAGSGEIDLTFINPDPPTGWTLTAEAGVGFNDQDPSGIFSGPLVAAENDPPTGTLTLTGLGSNVLCVVAGWLVWTKPNGDLAYSVGITTTATTPA